MPFTNPSDDELRALLTRARRIAVVGASARPDRPSLGIMKLLIAAGFDVVPVTPMEDKILGRPTYKTLSDVPGPIDMATVYVQPEIAMRLLDEFDRKGIPEVWINPGAETDQMLAEKKKRKANLIFACSILGVGRSPGEF